MLPTAHVGDRRVASVSSLRVCPIPPCPNPIILLQVHGAPWALDLFARAVDVAEVATLWIDPTHVYVLNDSMDLIASIVTRMHHLSDPAPSGLDGSLQVTIRRPEEASHVFTAARIHDEDLPPADVLYLVEGATGGVLIYGVADPHSRVIACNPSTLDGVAILKDSRPPSQWRSELFPAPDWRAALAIIFTLLVTGTIPPARPVQPSQALVATGMVVDVLDDLLTDALQLGAGYNGRVPSRVRLHLRQRALHALQRRVHMSLETMPAADAHAAPTIR